jgi:hypothetical protein
MGRLRNVSVGGRTRKRDEFSITFSLVWMFVILMGLSLLAVGCSHVKKIDGVEVIAVPAGEKVPPLPTPAETIESLLAKPASAYPLKGWHNDYDKILQETAKKIPVQVPCDDPALFFKAIAYKETSGFNRNSSYMEPPPLGYTSDGLLQLSIEDERTYKCGFTTRESVRHPIRNLYCGVKILARIQSLQKFKGKSIYYQAGQYWSVMRDYGNWPKANGRLKAVKAYFNSNSQECVWE